MHYTTVPVLFLILFILSVGTCSGETIVVKTIDDFNNIMELSQKEPFNCDIELEVDLSLGSLLTVPLGLKNDNNCIPYSGTFDGKGHSITDVVMSSDQRQYKNSALFCGLKDATIRNLVIDKSCSFSGINASALCLSVSGNINIESVINEASVTGTKFSSGFIGEVGAIQNPNITITNCENKGMVIIDNGNSAYLSGFIATISRTTGMELIINSCKNSGKLTSTTSTSFTHAGGFIGEVVQVSSSDIIITDSFNSGEVMVNSGGPGRCSGFLGIIYKGQDVKILLNNNANTGALVHNTNSYDNDGNIGSFVSYISKMKSFDILFSNCSNHGEIKGHFLDASSGFIGDMYASNGFQINVAFIDCSNYGNIVSDSELSCGFFCVQPIDDYSVGVITTVENCLNKGIVVGADKCYGIANKITTGSEIVSMGTVYGKTSSYLFWGSSDLVLTAFGLDRVCVNCGDDIDQFTEVNGEYFFRDLSFGIEMRLDYLLNSYVINEDYSVGWDKNLQLVLSRPSSPYIITTMKDFVYFETIASEGLLGNEPLDVILETDLDFSLIEMKGPLGVRDDANCFPFSGSFDGNGHSVKNLKMNSFVSSFFCKLEDAIIKNITFENTCRFSGSLASSVSIQVTKNVQIQNVINRAEILGSVKSSGFVCTNPLGLTILLKFVNCINEGMVKSANLACGFSCAFTQTNQNGEKLSEALLFFFNSANKGTVNSSSDSFGFSPLVYFADNVINVGDVLGQTSSFSFWIRKADSTLYTSSVFGLKSNCNQCVGDSIELFYLNKKGKYVVDNGKNIPLINTLNANVKDLGYGHLWTEDLDMIKE